MTDFGRNLRIARENQGLTQSDMARGLGISRSYLSEMESGKAENPSVKICLLAADICAVSVESLFDRNPHLAGAPPCRHLSIQWIGEVGGGIECAICGKEWTTNQII